MFMSHYLSCARALRRYFGHLVVLGILAVPIFFFVSTHNQYYGKVRAAEAIRYGKQVGAVVEEQYKLDRRFPSNLDALALLPGEPGYTPTVSIDPINGVLRIRVAETDSSVNSLELAPAVEPSGQLKWVCRNVSVPTELVPAECGA